MKLHYFLLLILFASCKTNNTKKSPPLDSTAVVMMDTLLPTAQSLTQQESSDSIYKIGDYLFEGDKNLVFDFFQNSHRPNQLKSIGDTIYSDSAYTILGDYNKVGGTFYKKYIPKYRFDNYKVDKIYTGSLSKPNFLTDPPARIYQTGIRKYCSDSTVNFAGHYTVAEWGCGTECLMMAVVDRKNGSLFYSPNYLPFDTIDGHWGVDYRKDSRLIIVNSYLLDDYPGYIMLQNSRKLSYYKWQGNGFVKLE